MRTLKLERIPEELSLSRYCPRCSSNKIYQSPTDFICMTCCYMVLEE